MPVILEFNTVNKLINKISRAIGSTLKEDASEKLVLLQNY